MPQSSGLFFDDIVKSFGGTQALRGVSLHIKRGEIVALLGENGAGKSTLIKVLGGIHKPDRGQVNIDGVEYTHKPGSLSEKQTASERSCETGRRRSSPGIRTAGQKICERRVFPRGHSRDDGNTSSADQANCRRDCRSRLRTRGRSRPTLDRYERRES